MNIKIFSIFTLATLILLSCGQNQKSGSSNKKTTKTLVKVPEFNADSAYSFVEKQVLFGPRVPGSKAHSECANWLTEKFNEYSDTVFVQAFKARTYDGVTRNGKNIIASFNPKNKNRLLLMSHWDSRPFADHDSDVAKHKKPIDGANDGASGVGILMEMARQFSLKHPEAGVDIVLFDLEDWGPPTQLEIYTTENWGLGAQYWSKNPHVFDYSAHFGILLDMVGTRKPIFPREYFSQQYAPFAMDLVWDYATALGYGDFFVNQQGPSINDDHFFVNTIAGIPSIDIIHLDRTTINRSFFEHWHTQADNMENIEKSTLEMVGNVMMTVAYNE